MSPDLTHSSRLPTTEDLSLNRAGPIIDRATAKKELSPGLEIEAKFFMPRAIAQKLTAALPFIQIEQRYFPRDLVRPLLERFLKDSTTGASLESSSEGRFGELSIARIRRTRRPREEPNYFIEFKGAKEGSEGSRISRREISEAISAQQYKALKEEASAGTIRKRRYAIPGTVIVKGEALPVIAQIDCLQAAGKKLHKVSTKFDTVDIELQDPTHIDALRAGHHSFGFLGRCIELSAHNEKLSKPLTTRRLARKGLHPDAVKAIKRLEAEAQRRKGNPKN